jgi:hypothetical protein
MSLYNGHDYISKLKEKWEMEEFIQSGKEEKVTGLDTIGTLEPEPNDFQPIEGEDISKLADRILDLFISKRKDLLEENISQINNEITVRHVLNHESDNEIGTELKDTEIFIEHLAGFVMGQNRGADLARVESLRRMGNLRNEQRHNTVKCWENLVILRKDLRNQIAEREAIVRTQQLLSF